VNSAHITHNTFNTGFLIFLLFVILKKYFHCVIRETTCIVVVNWCRNNK